MRNEPKTLRDAYELYKQNKPSFGRQDMIGRMVTEIEALQARIGAVDEAAVASLDKRVTGIEVGIGNALTQAMRAQLDDDINTSMDAASKAVRYEGAKRRGRPPRAASGEVV